ncbi:hypothetical protein [Lentzea sp. NPDC051838]|uniref:hypothetical protein n=1 Tax=Lentzea sp. NPDC051838 TaxID=3154849 RepID=UPI0034385FBC
MATPWCAAEPQQDRGIKTGNRTHLTFADVLVMAQTLNVGVAELFDGYGPVATADHVVQS